MQDCSGFNPRPRAGGDLKIGWQFDRRLQVSIHAPARGATPSACRACDGYVRVSIHAPARGATATCQIHAPAVHMFQSTPPRGGRPAAIDGYWRRRRVSIHAPARGATRALQSRCLRLPRVSIHAPARGATMPIRSQEFVHDPVSIHAPARGATQHGLDCCTADFVFQSTPPRGGRPSRCEIESCTIHRFNPRPRAGGDAWSCSADRQSHDVSIHAPARGATGIDSAACVDASNVSIHAPARGAT